MGDNDATVRLRARWDGNPAMTAQQAAELRELYSELRDATAAAAEALSNTGPVPAGMPLQRFREIDSHVAELVDRIRAILD
jgi:hypothetical protein